MAKQKSSPQEQLSAYYAQLDHPLSGLVTQLRNIILESDALISEQIKWNSPAFYYTGDLKPFDPKEYKRDIVVFNMHKKDALLLVFPTGARIPDTTGLLEGNFPDGRKTIKFTSAEEVSSRADDLRAAIKAWIETADKA